MQQIFTDNTLRGSERLSGMITVPQSQNIPEFMDCISKVPESDAPAMFGLPSNIDRSVQRVNSSNVVNQLKQLAAVSAEELRFDKEKWSQSLGPICQMWSNIY